VDGIGRALFVLLVGLRIAGCGSTEQVTAPTAEERFENATQLFRDEDYLEAIEQFSVITLQHQGSAVADDAQFYLGECRFERHEYILASFEYEQLKRNMPASPLVPEAQYKLALSYYHLAPDPPLDPEYTLKAIDEFQSFVLYYPANERAPQAEEKIRELTNRLAKKDYDTARLYARMGYHRAAIVYYDLVMEKYHDTEFAPLSYLGKVESLIERGRFIEARKEVTKFLSGYPNSVLRARAEELRQQIEDRL
jgi:outer membrane protein assembly factor BamD